MPKTSRKRNIKGISTRKLFELKPLLDQWADRVEVADYIPSDPVLFLHSYPEKKDAELAGFFAAIMAWGRRDIVIAKVENLLERMDHCPYVFIRDYDESKFQNFQGFKHRTFTAEDVHWLVTALSRILKEFEDFEAFWAYCYATKPQDETGLMSVFHEAFFARIPEAPQRVKKHIANPAKKSSCKRLYLYLRWTVRKNSPVDLGIHSFIEPSELMLPLDVHVARHARRLGILTRPQNDWQAVRELTEKLRLLNRDDPARYDYALFGLGIEDLDVPGEIIINDFV